MSLFNCRSLSDAVKRALSENPSQLLSQPNPSPYKTDNWVERGGILVSPETDYQVRVKELYGRYTGSSPSVSSDWGTGCFAVPLPLPPVPREEPQKAKWPAVRMGEVGQCQLQTPKTVIPDTVTTLLAYRAWEIEGDVIASLSYENQWEPKESMKATCQAEHCVPNRDHSCGIYGFKTLDILINQLRSDQWAFKADEYCLGVVELWGRYVEYEYGWRAQYAYPKELWFFGDQFENIAANYGVKYRVLPLENKNG